MLYIISSYIFNFHNIYNVKPKEMCLSSTTILFLVNHNLRKDIDLHEFPNLAQTSRRAHRIIYN